jgi:hypothetical protein
MTVTCHGELPRIDRAAIESPQAGILRCIPPLRVTSAARLDASELSGLGTSDSVCRACGVERGTCQEWQRNVLLTYFPFRLTWTRQEPDSSSVKVAKACALRVH